MVASRCGVAEQGGFPGAARDTLFQPCAKIGEPINPDVVLRWQEAAQNRKLGFASGLFIKMGLAGVVSTQLWHHLFVQSNLAELPSSVQAPVVREEMVA